MDRVLFQVRIQFDTRRKVFIRFYLVAKIDPDQTAIEVSPVHTGIEFDRACEVIDGLKHHPFEHVCRATSLMCPCHIRRQLNRAFEVCQRFVEVFYRKVQVTSLIERFRDLLVEFNRPIEIG